MKFEPRLYRNQMQSERFHSFVITCDETDLWIGVDPDSFSDEMVEFCRLRALEARSQIIQFSKETCDFITSLVPLDIVSFPHPVIERMVCSSRKANVGPMAAVAGAIAQWVGEKLKTAFHCKEIIVENGGDIWACFEKSILISVFAGNSLLNEKIGIEISPEYSPLGICTSSSTVGHSLSFGKADAVVVAAKDAATADAYATALCNKILKKEDIDAVVNSLNDDESIYAVTAIMDDVVGITGVLEIKIL